MTDRESITERSRRTADKRAKRYARALGPTDTRDEHPPGIQSVVPVFNPMRDAGAMAAGLFFPGTPTARFGFNGGVTWTLTQIKTEHPEAWALLEQAWEEME